MPAITLDAIEAKQTELSKLIEQFKEFSNQPTTHVFPQVEIKLMPGEYYAGPVLDQRGDLVHHLVMMAQRPTDKLNWPAAMDWATRIGGSLPTRQEQALLYANCKPHLKPDWHWSCEPHDDDASSAWYCYFSHGLQGTGHKSYEGCAVAVRRV